MLAVFQFCVINICPRKVYLSRNTGFHPTASPPTSPYNAWISLLVTYPRKGWRDHRIACGGGWVETCVAAQVDLPWTNIDNAKLEDGQHAFATTGLNPDACARMLHYNWTPAFSIPVGSTINGIEVGIKRRAVLYNNQSIDYLIKQL